MAAFGIIGRGAVRPTLGRFADGQHSAHKLPGSAKQNRHFGYDVGLSLAIEVLGSGEASRFHAK